MMSTFTMGDTLAAKSPTPLSPPSNTNKEKILIYDYGILFQRSIQTKFGDNRNIQSIGTYRGTDTLATKSPPTPQKRIKKIWISDYGFLFPYH